MKGAPPQMAVVSKASVMPSSTRGLETKPPCPSKEVGGGPGNKEGSDCREKGPDTQKQEPGLSSKEPGAAREKQCLEKPKAGPVSCP